MCIHTGIYVTDENKMFGLTDAYHRKKKSVIIM